MIKLMLNTHKFNNYAFFCPVSRLHLTVSSPVGYTNEVTAAILRALKAETILDVDGVIDIEAGTVKAEGVTNIQSKQEEKAPEQSEGFQNPEQKNNGNTKQNTPDENEKTVEPENTTEEIKSEENAEKETNEKIEQQPKKGRGKKTSDSENK